MINMNKRNKLDALVGAVGAVFGMGGYVGHLYSRSIATFGMMAIIILGAAAVRMMDSD